MLRHSRAQCKQRALRRKLWDCQQRGSRKQMSCARGSSATMTSHQTPTTLSFGRGIRMTQLHRCQVACLKHGSCLPACRSSVAVRRQYVTLLCRGWGDGGRCRKQATGLAQPHRDIASRSRGAPGFARRYSIHLYSSCSEPRPQSQPQIRTRHWANSAAVKSIATGRPLT